MLQAGATVASLGHRSIFSSMTVGAAAEDDEEGDDPEAPVSTRKVGFGLYTWGLHP